MDHAILTDYQSKRPKYEAFCAEIARIVENSFQAANTRYHSIESRAKTISSFEEKLKKVDENGSPKYTQPLTEITDLAGVRIIAYTIDDIQLISSFIDKNFNILEKRDVGQERIDQGQFGYQSIHYLVKLPEGRLALPDFSTYEDLVCEIQVRTVLQHAWAEMEHDIQYKGSQNIPSAVKRKFLSLAGLLEIADREFASIQRDDKELKRGILTDLHKDLTLDAISKSSGSSSSNGRLNPSQDDQKSREQVRSLLAAGKFKEAIAIYDEKIDHEPTSYTLYIGRARALFLSGETERALRDIERAEELQPGNPVSAGLRSRIADGSLSVTNSPKNLESNVKVKAGDKALSGGRPEEAYILYDEAQSLGASWPFTTFKMALAGVTAGDLSGAEILIDQLKIHPGTPMEVNIIAFKAMLSALRGSDDYQSFLEQLHQVKNEMGDFNISMSPVALIRDLDGKTFWNDHADKIAKIFKILE